MEVKKVKISNLKIDQLYGCYNYDIKFNPDVTFLHGTNGCGKTTVLNIVTSIITGELFKLFLYDFKKIILTYYSAKNKKSIKTIEINMEEKNTELIIRFNNEVFKIEYISNSRMSRDRNFEIPDEYFHRYEELEIIRSTFNYVYLPLNRYISLQEDRIFENKRRNGYFDNGYGTDIPKDKSMSNVEMLVKEKSNAIRANISEINDKFRNNILKSFLDISEQKKVNDILQTYNELKTKASDEKEQFRELRKTKDDYLKILKELNLINEVDEVSYENFFNAFITELKENAKATGISAEPFLKFSEIFKIQRIVALAKEMEKSKDNINQPIEKFLNIVNEFIYSEEDEKRIEIDSMGWISFHNNACKKTLSIHSLSSGEKQLLTFFSNLIFNVKPNQSGIFVVDEPELSLHLMWQKKFAEKTLEVNDKIQLIFATHSPEFIGKYYDKVEKLERYL